MIQTPTVFILGAGASAPYGYPIGTGLIDSICDNIGNGNLSTFVNTLIHSGQSSQKDIIKFKRALELSRKSSIDAFLEHRKEFMKVGKLAIASVLIQAEMQYKLFNVKNCWYSYFYNQLNTSFEQFDKNKVSIITFNYDRSLEHYLCTTLTNSYPVPQEECSKKIMGMKIIHLHGQLSKLPWQIEPIKEGQSLETYRLEVSRNYANKDVTTYDIKTAAEGIRIIHEDFDHDKDEKFSIARELIRKGQRIYFVGFGYDEENIKRLQIPTGKHITGSTYGLESGEIRKIQRFFEGQNIRAKLADNNEDAYLFMRRAVDWD